MTQRTYKIAVTFKDANRDVEHWVRVGYSFENGFLVIDGQWDTFYLSLDTISEVRIVEADYGMDMLYKSDEYVGEVALAERNSSRLVKLYKEVVSFINALKTWVVFKEPPTVEELVELNDMLEPDQFKLELAEGASNQYRIIVLAEQQ
jgi:hypothetical protein